MRDIKSKRHAEANIMNRFRNSLAPGNAFKLPTLSSLGSVLGVVEAAADAKADATDGTTFPRRERCGVYQLNTSDLEQMHQIFCRTSTVYQRIVREHARYARSEGVVASHGPGEAIHTWEPWLPGTRYTESREWQRQNGSLSLVAALRAFRTLPCNVIYTGVRHAGVKRSGSFATQPSAEHKHAYSIFRFRDGSESEQVGRILFMFRVKLPAIVADRVRLLLICYVISVDHVCISAQLCACVMPSGDI